MSLTEHLLGGLPSARPLITHYDDAAGSRVELSVATARNWAAKTANWLVEEHDVEPGDPVAVGLPAHWQTAGVLLGAWWAGAHVVPLGTPGARVTFVPGERGKPVAGSFEGPVAAVSLHPMGMDLGGSVEGAVDFVGEVRLFGDDFFGASVDDDVPALAGASVAEVLKAARGSGLPAEARVLSTVEWTVPDGVLSALVAPLSVGGSVVQVSNPARLDAHRTAERATVDLPG